MKYNIKSIAISVVAGSIIVGCGGGSETTGTALISSQIAKNSIQSLPIENAIKITKGTGEREFAVFMDPSCPHCAALERNAMNEVDNYTAYVFLYPFLNENSEKKARIIWCSNDKVSALNNWAKGRDINASQNCDAPLEKNIELAKRFNIKHVPTIIYKNGETSTGEINATDLENNLKLNQ